jgi:hypothetical protein
VIGGIVFVLAMVIAVPVGVMLAGGVWSALFGAIYPTADDGSSEAPAPGADA